MTMHETVRSLTETCLADSGLQVLDVTVTRAGRRSVVKVVLDRPAETDPDGVSRVPTAPLSLDEIADATRVISRACDDEDGLGDAPYTLEVTSPGTDRPLRAPHGYRRNVGRRIRVTLEQGGVLEGRVLSADDAGVTLGTEPDARILAWSEIARAVVLVDFAPTRPEGE